MACGSYGSPGCAGTTAPGFRNGVADAGTEPEEGEDGKVGELPISIFGLAYRMRSSEPFYFMDIQYYYIYIYLYIHYIHIYIYTCTCLT